MAQPYVGEIRMFAGNFAPAGWMFCDGQLLPIAENDILFTLIGTTYGGDGQETFGLPNLQSRIPIHQGTDPGGNTYTLGEAGGVETVTLTVQQIPIHTHTLLVSNSNAQGTNPTGNFIGQSAQAKLYIEDVGQSNMDPNTISPVGGSQPHENLQPYICINYIISLFGLFPPQG